MYLVLIFFIYRYVDGRVLCALANGTVVVFRRDSNGRWDLSKYHSVTLGPPQNAARCLVSVNSKRVWCGYKNKVHIIHPRSLVVIVSTVINQNIIFLIRKHIINLF